MVAQAEQARSHGIFGRRLPEQAERLGVSTSTLHRAIRAGRLQAHRVCGGWFVRDEDIDVLVQRETSERLQPARPIQNTYGAGQSELAVLDRALEARGF